MRQGLLTLIRNSALPFGAIFLTMTISCGASAQSPIQELTKLQESYSEGVNLSGSLLVGIRQGGAINQPLDLKNLSVTLPRTAHKQLCLAMTTRDGRYFAEQTFEIGNFGPGVQSLPLQSRYAEKLHAYSTDDLALRVELRDQCDDGAAGAYVLSSLAGGTDAGMVTLYVNTKNSEANATILNAKNEILARIDHCDEFTSGARTAFDHVCRLQLTDADRVSATKLTLRVIGATGSYRDYSYPIALGPAR